MAKLRIVENYTDLRALTAYLLRDPLRAAYELADLAPYHRRHSTWHVALAGPLDIRATLLVYANKVILTQGETEAAAELFHRVRVLPDSPHFHLQHGHEVAAAARFVLNPYPLWRMGLVRERFRPPESTGVPGPVVLGAADAPEIEDLVAVVFGSTVFDPHIEDRPHVGIREGGRLVAVAGTLAINDELRIAVVGPVGTLPDSRSKGYATLCTAALCRRLLQRVDTIALSVRRSVPAAHSLYRKLGFADHHTYLEGSGVAKRKR